MKEVIHSKNAMKSPFFRLRLIAAEKPRGDMLFFDASDVPNAALYAKLNYHGNLVSSNNEPHSMIVTLCYLKKSQQHLLPY